MTEKTHEHFLSSGSWREIPRPRRISINDDGSTLRISFWWIRPGFINGIIISFLWNSFMVGWYWYWTVFRPPGREIWLGVVCGVPFAASGLLVLYATLALLLNRTVIRVTSELVTVRHGPLPLRRNRSLQTNELERLYCATVKNRKSCSYTVGGELKGPTKIDLITNINNLAEALFIKQEVERWLAIPKAAP
jgi:hypothetical protein